MTQQVSVRRAFLCVICLGCALFLISLHQRWTWTPEQTIISARNTEAEVAAEVTAAEVTAPESIPQNNAKVIVTTTPTASPASQTTNNSNKPWFLSGGIEIPSNFQGIPKLFPHQDDGDRIVEQLMYVPADYKDNITTEKVIFSNNPLMEWNKMAGTGAFDGCPVDRCTLTDDVRQRASDADAILFKDYFEPLPFRRPEKQIWILYYLESPYHTFEINEYFDGINWTATYRRDSDIVTPYERWYYYNPQVRQIKQTRDYAANKTKKVAWFVSNCVARNRLQYALELSKHISVDIYGRCGTLYCPRYNKKCFEALDRDYKFYLSFENSNCRDYITEKFFVNGLGQNVLPIVMGAHPEDYERSAPEGSYIHVDEFASPRELADYLHLLDQDDDLYNSYFRWKGTGEFINTYFWCRLCAMVHAPLSLKHYENINKWWRGTGVCTKNSWSKKSNS